MTTRKIIKNDGNQFKYIERVTDSLFDNPRSGIIECESKELAQSLCELANKLLSIETRCCVIREKELNFYNFTRERQNDHKESKRTTQK